MLSRSFMRAPWMLSRHMCRTSCLVASYRRCSHGSQATWSCGCGFQNYSYRDACFQCNTPKPVRNTNSAFLKPTDTSGSFPAADTATSIAFRRGDWICACGAHNFARRQSCLVCAAPRKNSPEWTPGSMTDVRPPKTVPFRPGDWRCPECDAHNFRSRGTCMRCGVARPMSSERIRDGGAVDWVCTECHTSNASHTSRCETCQTARPATAVPHAAAASSSRARPGDWHCVACGFLNFASRTSCKRCHAAAAATPSTTADAPVGSFWTCSCGYCNTGTSTDCRECGSVRPTRTS